MSDTPDEIEDDAEVEEFDDGQFLSQYDLVAQIREEGGNWKEFDASYVCLISPQLYGDEDRQHRGAYAPKALLGNVPRVEKLRWKAAQKLARLRDRWTALYREVFKAGGECFIARNEPSRFSRKRRVEADYPIRVEVMKSSYEADGLSSHYDADFYKYDPTPHNGTDMEVIASAAELGEWEQIILPERLARAYDPKKLEMGHRWRHIEVREQALMARLNTFNEMLKRAVILVDVIPRSPPHRKTTFVVQINGRTYPFIGNGGEYISATFEEWPNPDNPTAIVVSDAFAFDETLIGRSADAVRTRIGEPALIIDGVVWRYPQGTVTFKKGHYGTVISVDQTPNDISALSPSPAPRRASGRGAKEPAQGRKGRRSKRKSRSGGGQGVDGVVRPEGKAARSGSRKTRQAT